MILIGSMSLISSISIGQDGAEGRDRTGTGRSPRDFESRASTDSTTPAVCNRVCYMQSSLS